MIESAGRGLGARGENVCELKRLLIFAFCVDGWMEALCDGKMVTEGTLGRE